MKRERRSPFHTPHRDHKASPKITCLWDFRIFLRRAEKPSNVLVLSMPLPPSHHRIMPSTFLMRYVLPAGCVCVWAWNLRDFQLDKPLNRLALARLPIKIMPTHTHTHTDEKQKPKSNNNNVAHLRASTLLPASSSSSLLVRACFYLFYFMAVYPPEYDGVAILRLNHPSGPITLSYIGMLSFRMAVGCWRRHSFCVRRPTNCSFLFAFYFWCHFARILYWSFGG